MEPIINPLYLYLMSVAGKVGFVSVILTILLGVIAFISNFMYYAADVISEDRKTLRKTFKYSFVCAIIFLIIAIIIPSEKTLIAMIAASYINPDNIVIAEDHIVELIEKIIMAVNKH